MADRSAFRKHSNSLSLAFQEFPMRRSLIAPAASLLAVLCLSPVTAAPVVPTFTTFGPLPAATFGGSGIPNDAVAITTIDFGGGNSITLGMTAHGRFLNAPVTNNGAGVYFATNGANFGDPTGNTMPSSLLGATWNFAYYSNVQGTVPGGLILRLLYDFDPAVGNDASTHGTITGPLPLGTFEGSQNLLFGFLSVPSPGITPPTFGPFDPNALGQYTFALQVLQGNQVLGQSAILVNVTPEPASLAVWSLLGAAGTVYGWRRRKRA